MNIQYAIEDGKVYVLEANPRASRTVPLVSKVCNIQMARDRHPDDARRHRLADLKLKQATGSATSASRKRCFPFDKFPEVDPVLGPRCAPPARSWGWPPISASPTTRPRRAPAAVPLRRHRADQPG